MAGGGMHRPYPPMKISIDSCPAWGSALKGRCREQVGMINSRAAWKRNYQDHPILQWWKGDPAIFVNRRETSHITL